MHMPIPTSLDPLKVRCEMQIGQSLVDVCDAQKRLELVIAMTPTGEARNKLCDANIHLMAAIAKLQE